MFNLCDLLEETKGNFDDSNQRCFLLMWTSDSEGAKQTFDEMEMFVVRFICGQMAVYI